MTRLEKYMLEPSIANEPMPLREVHAIRLMIYDDTKDMTPDETRAYYMSSFEEASKRHNFNLAATARS